MCGLVPLSLQTISIFFAQIIICVVVVRPVPVRSRTNDRGQILQLRGVFARLQARPSRGLAIVFKRRGLYAMASLF